MGMCNSFFNKKHYVYSFLIHQTSSCTMYLCLLISDTSNLKLCIVCLLISDTSSLNLCNVCTSTNF